MNIEKDLVSLSKKFATRNPVVAVSSKGWCELTAYMTDPQFLGHIKAAKPAGYSDFKSVLDAIVAQGIPDDKAIIIDSLPQPPDPEKVKQYERTINGPNPRNRAERRRMQHGKKKGR